MARTTKEEALKTRQKIMDTAIELFFRQGVPSTTLEQIADAADLTRGAIYWHFEGKLALVSAIHERFHICIMDAMFADLKDQSRSPFERIGKAGENFLQSLIEDERRRKILTIFMLKCDYSGEMADFLDIQSRKREEGILLYSQCFQEAIDRGELDGSQTAEFLAAVHMVFMSGMILEFLRNAQGSNADRPSPQAYLHFFMKAFSPKADPPGILI